jgi:hypothetical protein
MVHLPSKNTFWTDADLNNPNKGSSADFGIVRTSTMNALRGEREVRSPIKDKDPPRVPNWCPSQSTNKTGEAWSTGNAAMSDALVVQKAKVDAMSADMLISENVEHRCWRHVESSVEVEEEKKWARVCACCGIDRRLNWATTS